MYWTQEKQRTDVTGRKVNDMFTVIDADTSELVKVFAVKDDSTGYPNFLIFDGSWKYRSAKNYIPTYEFSESEKEMAQITEMIKKGTY